MLLATPIIVAPELQRYNVGKEMSIPTFSAPEAMGPARAILEGFLEESREQATSFKPGETIQCMWMLFKIGGTEESMEIMSPRLGTFPMQFHADCSEALNLVLKQRYVCDSFETKIVPCHALQTIITATDIENCSDIYLGRSEPKGHDSGWFLGAQDSNSDLDNLEDLKVMSLWEASCLFPEITEFFHLPPEWQVIFDREPTVLKEQELIKPMKGSYFERKYK